jgi:hypothetical protein
MAKDARKVERLPPVQVTADLKERLQHFSESSHIPQAELVRLAVEWLLAHPDDVLKRPKGR